MRSSDLIKIQTKRKMRNSENIDVQKFLSEMDMIDSRKCNILIELREIIFNIFPLTKEKIMYGGIVFSLNEKMFSGLFIFKNHVTIEFSKGFQMEDPNNHLEGKGKFRRHLKFLGKEDIVNKEVSFFVKQAV